MAIKERKRVRNVRRSRPDATVYTQAKPFNRQKLLLRLATVVAVVLALVFGMSIFFKVQVVNVSGASLYTEYDIFEASGIRKGDSLLGLSKARISGKIHELDYVDDIRIRVRLPGTVEIEITEMEVVYEIFDAAGQPWYISSQGKVLGQQTSLPATQILGVLLTAPVQGELAAAQEPVPSETTDGAATVQIPASEQLAAALSMAQYLEGCGVLGEAISLDVSNMSDLRINYSDRYQFLLGDSSQLGVKIAQCVEAAKQVSSYKNGTIDASFTLRPEVIFTPAEES